eukprot:gene208-211_t
MSIYEAFSALQDYVDSSDPDVELPNMIHMLQTAEGIRKAGKPDWFQLVGLIHDMGKIMFLWGDDSIGQQGTANGQQWALGGDTFVVGCRIPDSIVFPEFNSLNPDMQNDMLNTELGIYTPQCGINKLRFCYGHDEYLYQMLQGLDMIRYHSAYCWHSGGAYRCFMTEEDHDTLKWYRDGKEGRRKPVTQAQPETILPIPSFLPYFAVREFNAFDLYTKGGRGLERTVEELWPYYQSLINKYFPNSPNGQLLW